MHIELKQEPGFEVDLILLPNDIEKGFFKMIFGQQNINKEIPISDFNEVNGRLLYHLWIKL